MCSPLIDVQIVNYNTYGFLVKCVESVFEDAKCSNIPIAVRVVDNASGDDVDKICLQFPEVHPRTLIQNIGYGAAHNFLSNEGDAPFILILNPDVVIQEKDTLKRLLTQIRTGTCHITGPRLVTPKGETQWWDHGDLGHAWREALVRKFGRNIYQLHSEPTEVAWVSGAFLLISRNAFLEVGRFDKGFFLYKEEEDLCLRLHQLGHRILYDPTVSVFHHGSVVASKAQFMRASEEYFIQKHCRLPWRWLARAALYLKYM